MFLIPVLFVATFLVIVGYFIQFAAQRAEGFLKPFGKYLSLWVFVLAGLVIVAAAIGPGPGFRGPGARGIGPGFFRGRGFGGPPFERVVPREGTQPPQNSTPAPTTSPAAPPNP